ncbi:terminase large subunit domain-containing protein [Zunongwangia profunda]|jgi:hypothetical protein|uniref:terminase large subunit domain-containing protein n=1 Tax=Zunongwangia profunda TaxID=398743 RepID=UPI0030D76D3A|tara:strand:- start:2435 stop:4267 length:1833 start_codon:yes stop_codon:yes gene_type:complete
MWYCPEKYSKPVPNLNEELLKLKGELPDRQAKITLAKFMRSNLGFSTELLSGIKLALYQEITLKAFFNRNFSMCVWGRGCGKSFIAAVYCFLQCIFEPRTKILIAGPTFRTARFIFNNLEKIVESKEAQMLAHAFGAKSKRNDQFEWKINEGTITAIPLSGEKIRGFRANILVLDEFLLLPEETIKSVLMPFLVAPQDMAERIKIREMEDDLIKKGQMQEKDRVQFTNNSKMIALSSASFSFENLFKTYKEWMNNIYSEEIQQSNYFISQMGFNSIPTDMIDRTVIEEAQAGGSSNSSFQREYCAQFTDGSDSYFSAKKMHDCTIPDGEKQHTLIKGDPEKKYILAIDPSFSNSPSSDYFAMSVLELDEDKGNESTLVHAYAVAGGDLKDHIKYLYYLMTSFKIELLIIDNAGYQFIDSANESELFRDARIDLKFFDFNSDKNGNDYQQMLLKAKRQYNVKENVICFKQLFSSTFLREANEYLQASIDHKRIWFASRTAACGSFFDKASAQAVPIKLMPYENKGDLIEFQDDIIYQTKKQCALVEVKTTAKGMQTFDLPQHLKRSTSVNRARKDNYTTLMLGNWGIKAYNDLKNTKVEQISNTFTPRMLG